MAELLSDALLLCTVGLPLLLAIPALRARVPRPALVALLPALLLVSLPITVSIEIPWLLFGSGFAYNETYRPLILSMVVLWGAGSIVFKRSAGGSPEDSLTTCLLLTMAGNLGALSAIDVVTFFSFSTLMGYGFYALLAAGGDGQAQRAARLYLVVLILADLLLFDALILAAISTGDLRFEAVRQAMSQSPSAGSYLVMVFLGFAAKAAIWPLHIWLTALFRCARPAAALLIGGVPLAVALLGMVRWLPLGQIGADYLGVGLQALGAAGILYTLLIGLKGITLTSIPGYTAITATGLFTIALGVVLETPDKWSRYEAWAIPCITALGSILALVVAAVAWEKTRRHAGRSPAESADEPISWYEHWQALAARRGLQIGLEQLPRWREAWVALGVRLWQRLPWNLLEHGERTLQRWGIATALVLLLGILLAILGALT